MFLFCLQPSWIKTMTNLTNIYLQANRFTQLPENIGFLINLETLDVSHNQLTSLPQSIGHLSKLRRLVLTHNELLFLPDSLGQLQELTSLQLAGNHLFTLPYSISQCTNLKELNVDANRFQSLPNFLTRLPSLKSLSVCSNRLENLPSVPFASLERFHFDGNSQLTHLPYPIACQLNCTPSHPLATRNVLHISCHGCFQPLLQSDSGSLLVSDSSDTIEPLYINPCVPVSSSQPLASLKELSLRSVFSSMYSQRKPVVVVADVLSNLHSFRTVYHEDYDLRLPALLHHLPLNLIEMLIEGPVAFCLHCVRPIFSLGPVYPLFVLKMMVSRETAAGALIQPVVCSVFFCSVQCSFSYKSMFEPLLDWRQLDATW